MTKIDWDEVRDVLESYREEALDEDGSAEFQFYTSAMVPLGLVEEDGVTPLDVDLSRTFTVLVDEGTAAAVEDLRGQVGE